MKSVILNWSEPLPLVGDLPAVLGKVEGFGVFAFTGRHYGHDGELLLSMGKTVSSFRDRIWGDAENRDWVQRMSEHLGARFWYAKMDDPAISKNVLSAMVHVHQPPYNAREIATASELDEHLLIYNTGCLPPHVLPIVATDYPWFGNPTPFRVRGA